MHARRPVLTPDTYALRFSYSLDDARPRSASTDTTLRAIELTALQAAEHSAFRGWGTINAHAFRSVAAAGGSLLPEAVSLPSGTESTPVVGVLAVSLPTTFAAGEYSLAGDVTPSGGTIAALGFYKTFSSTEPPARALLSDGPPAAIPEPSTVVLLAAGSLVVFLRMRRARSDA
ncbi:PEP-CTERM sorting domain-containing protein [Horticoccus sp. 23ND18S-11]|uniref:PEP-CTERM sorting domain-containing protein n=1 Tax=Horticoccus sp. 23ND18S-11 TaxID=3391832 RepID=UPI0039C9FB92